MRIASLCPSNTELLEYLGLSDSVVGVDNYSDWPENTKRLPRLGPDLDIDMDALEALRPDLVVASLSVPGMEKNIAGLKERGLSHIVLNPNSLGDIGQTMLQIGEATDTLVRAKTAYHKYKESLDFYAELSSTIADRPTLYWEWWPKPVFTPGGANWLTEISELAGARNVYEDHTAASVQTDWDDVLTRNPDYILLAWVGIQPHLVKPDTVRQRPGSSKLQAVQQNQIHVMEEPLYCRPSPRLFLGLQKLASILHPEVFPAYDSAKWENRYAD
ncbi:cobalamin-binding protein [Paenibacillus gansuensis]|uniref:Cobalamin-binding protein n=1 Tax=Paenibacillus gansuensis TaxID=306542 RepID=A0ABW5PK73_9BACL